MVKRFGHGIGLQRKVLKKETNNPPKKSEKARKKYREQSITASIRHKLNIVNEFMMKQQVDCKSQKLSRVLKKLSVRCSGI